MKDTRTKILDTAEKLFAENGVAAVSLREINAAAGVSPSVLHYHFGGRDELITSMLERRLPALNAERSAMLEELLNSTGEVTVRQLLSVTVLPLVRLIREHGKAGQRFVKVLARLHLERNGVYQALTMKYYPETRLEVFEELLRRSAGCAPEIIETRLAMAIDAMFSTLAAFDMQARIWQRHLAVNPLPIDEAVEVLLDFMCAGVLNATPTPSQKTRKK
jgi:AcrR family transcriptional regulator